MKDAVEAWHLGYEEGWDDGFYDRQPKESFNFPQNYSGGEIEHFKFGYNKGFEDGHWES
jgi:hypothetical protein